MEHTKRLLSNELARAEAIITSADEGGRKAHQPTIDHHKGQAFALQKALAWLEMEQITPPGPVTIERQIRIVTPWSIPACLGLVLLWLTFWS